MELLRAKDESKASNHILALTGLRFLAALVVFVHHVNDFDWFPKLAFSPGDLGVSFFFVLSGFILTYVYHDRLKTTADVRRFYFTRWARIWPLHAVTLALWCWLLFELNGRGPLEWGGQLVANVLLLQSWVPNYDWIYGYNSVSWSISAEAFFYLVFPLLLLGGSLVCGAKVLATSATGKSSTDTIDRGFWIRQVVVLAGVALTLGVGAYHWGLYSTAGSWIQHKAFGDKIPLFRLFDFALGMAVAKSFLWCQASRATDRSNFFWRDSMLEVAALAFGGLLLGWLIYQKPFDQTGNMVIAQGGFSIVSALSFAPLIFVFGYSRGLFSKLVGCRLMVYLGEISFAFYMIHQIVLRQVNLTSWNQITVNSWNMAIGAFFVSLALSIFLYQLLEIPAKQALLRLYDRKPAKAASGLLNGISKGIFSNPVLIGAATLGLALAFLNTFRLTPTDAIEIDAIVDRTTLFEKPVAFQNEASLLGVVVDRVDDGIVVRTAWRSDPAQSRQRFIHACSADGEIVCHINAHTRRVEDQTAGDAWCDHLKIPAAKLKNVATLGLGFYSKEKNVAPMDSVPSGSENWRLDFYRIPAELAEAVQKNMK
jgi:peptidoglycan/LPS O-acetylase OafA/YrhL